MVESCAKPVLSRHAAGPQILRRLHRHDPCESIVVRNYRRGIEDGSRVGPAGEEPPPFSASAVLLSRYSLSLRQERAGVSLLARNPGSGICGPRDAGGGFLGC